MKQKNQDYRKEMFEGLSKLLADTFTLYLKTLNYHWNVVGPMFPVYHKLFEGQYKELQESLDQVAERIRSLGFIAPCSNAEFTRLTSLKESEGGEQGAQEMIRRALEGHEFVCQWSRSLFSLAEKGNDEATKDLLTQRICYHEKQAWILRSTLNEE